MTNGIINSGYNLTLERILSDFQLIRSRLNLVGIELHPSCRFSLFEREIQKTIKIRNSDLPSSEVNWSFIAEGFRDTAELKLITSSSIVLTAGIPILKQILSGTPMPSDDANSMARDKQFELYLAAILERTGFGVSIEEPDIIFTHNFKTYSLAAKRVKSTQQISKRYREAISQIKQYSNPGFIGLSLDYLVRGLGDKNIIAGSPEAMDQAGNEIILSCLENDLGPNISRYKDDQIVGILASLVIPSLLPNNMSFGSIAVLRAIYLHQQALDICRLIGSNTFTD